MSGPTPVLEYKCPCCNAGLVFDQADQKLSCEYCGNDFDLEAVREFNTPPEEAVEEPLWEPSSQQNWSDAEQEALRTFQCPACGGEIVGDETTAATFCPFCDNPAVFPGRLSGGLKPDAVIPFKKGKEDAKNAFRTLCKGKPLLPKGFADEQRVEKITGIYVPFWLYDCTADQSARYNATRVRHWSDAHYNYTRTDYFLVNRAAKASFGGIPMDGSAKMDNRITESIEPFDYSQMVDFDTAYLTGFFADKYDVKSEDGQSRIRQRVGNTLDSLIQQSLIGYTTAIPSNKNLKIQHGVSKYVLLPVWMLISQYKGKTYTFAMNGQTGKMTGSFPICPKRSFAWFAGVTAAVTAIVSLIQWLVL